MKSIVEEKLVFFKTLEQKVFAYVCELGRETTRIMLEGYDADGIKESVSGSLLRVRNKSGDAG